MTRLIEWLWRPQQQEHQLDAELRDHFEREVAERIAGGMSADAARREARLAVGDLEEAKDACRDVRPAAWLDQTVRDVGFALRQFRRSPALWGTIALTVALGIASSTTVFSIVDALLLRPLRYPDAGRLVSLGSRYRGEFVELQRRSRTLDLGAYMTRPPATLVGRGEPELVSVALANAELFAVLRSAAQRGRYFEASDTSPGAGSAVVIADGWWRRRFGADAAIVGQTLTLDGRVYTVIGVMPPEFDIPSDVHAWLPLIINPADRIDLWANGATLVGRLRDGITMEQAQSEVRALVPAFRELFPWKMPDDYGQSVTVDPLKAAVVGDNGAPVLVVFAAVLAVLVLLCVNVANLLLTRGLTRTRELSIRSAVGATRGRLLRQLLTESFTVTAAAGLLGVAASMLLLPLVARHLAAELPRTPEILLNGTAVTYAVMVATITGLLFGTIPALSVGRASAFARHPALNPREHRLARLCVAAEFAIAVMLVVAAGLVVGSVRRLLAVDVGFNAPQVLAATVVPPRPRYTSPVAYRQFVDRLAAQVGTSPDADAVAVATAAPFMARQMGGVFSIFGQPDPATESGAWPAADVVSAVTPDFFGVMSIPLHDGRVFTPRDSSDAPRVAVISRSLARTYWPGSSPVGERLRFPGVDMPWVTVIGVVDDIRWNNLGQERNWVSTVPVTALGAIFVPLSQRDRFDLSGVRLLVRTNHPDRLTGELRALVAATDRDAPVDDIRTMDARIMSSIARFRFIANLLSAFAALSLSLAAFGVYCLLSYSVARRWPEFAVRAALGASPARLVRHVVAEGVTLALIGTAVGASLAILGGRAISAVVFGAATDVPTVVAASAILLAVGALAAALAARQMLSIQPAAALQLE